MRLLSTYRIIWILLFGGSGLLSQNLYAQCTIDTSIIIDPVDTLEFELDIQGLLNDDMEDPAQGICGVRLSFEHEYLGDIYIELISPSGQRVRLIGPEVTSGFTQLSQWDILFVPCGFPISPDPGFSGQWSNDQPWGILNVYTGIYHPFSGCLEDFNTGPANGTWTLRIVDRSQFYGGEIKSITLIFCDPAGLDCVPCLADAGTWILEGDSLELCQNDGSLLLDTSLQYINGRPDSAMYGYGWTVSSFDTIRQWLSTPDLRSLSPGIYTVCGLSYRLSDSLSLPDGNDSLRLDSFRQKLISVEPPFCGDLTSSCAQVIISAIPDTIVTTDTICLGDSILWKGSVFKTSGVYEFIERSPPACDTIFQLSLVVIDLDPVISGLDTINCKRPSIILNAANSDTIPGTRFSWTFNGIAVTGAKRGRELSVTDSGTAVLILDFDLCRFSDSVFVIVDTLSPDIDLLVDTVNCNDPEARIEILNPEPGSLIEWSLSGMTVAMGPVWEMAPSGPASVEMTSRNGCRSTFDFFVPADTVPIEIQLTGDSLTCLKNSAMIQVWGGGLVRSFIWSGPGIIYETKDTSVVSLPGVYRYTAAGENGCDTVLTITIDQDIREPEFQVYLDTVTCLFDTVFPRIVNFIPGTDFLWEGPGGTIFRGERPALIDTGTYLIRAITSAGCVKDTTVRLTGDFAVPDFSLTTDTLGCEPDTIQIGVNITDPLFYDYIWTGPFGFSSKIREPLVDDPGQYILTVTSRNGCQISDSLQVFRSGEVPDITIESFGIDCNDSLGRIRVTSSTGVTYQWTGPGNFSSDEAIITDLLPGAYLLTVTDDKGCQNTQLVEIIRDISPPDISLFGDTITCTRKEIEVKFTSSGELDSFFWIAPDNSASTDSVLIISQPGLYQFLSRGKNDCTATDSIRIYLDTLPPDNRIIPVVIDCERPEAILKLDSYKGLSSLIWTMPDGSEVLLDSVQINEAGSYSVRVTALNGCSAKDAIYVDADTVPPGFFISADTLRCTPSRSTIFMNPDSGVATWRLEGPGGQFTDSTRVSVDVAGIYLLTWRGLNGCVEEDTFQVWGDTLGPDLELYAEQINCRKQDTLEIGVLGSYPNENFEWRGPANFGSFEEDTLTGISGWYYLESQGMNGCRSIDSVFIGYDTLPPSWRFLPPDTLDCRTDSIHIQVQRLSGPMRLAFDAPSGRLVNDSVWRTGDPGWYHVLAEGPNACIAIDSIELISERSYPELMASGGQLNCRDSTIRINALVDTFGGKFRWVGPMGFLSEVQNPSVRIPGLYVVSYSLANACSSVDSVYVNGDFQGPDALAIGDTITCDRSEVTLYAFISETNTQASWKDPMGLITTSDTLRTRIPGQYILEVLDSVGCISTDTIVIYSDTTAPSVVINQQGTLACGSGTVDLVAVFSGGSTGLRWEWIHPDGSPFGNMQQRVSVDTKGIYILMAEDTLTGCSVSQQVTLDDSGQSIFAEWMAIAPRCPGESSGKLVLDSIAGQKGSISIFINERPLPDQDTIRNLAPGMYSLRITDSLGCQWAGDLVIPSPDTLWVDLGPDRTIFAGEQLTLNPMIYSGATGVQLISWNPPNKACPLCLIRTEQPTSDSKYRIAIQDARGCQASDEIQIFVRKKSGIFLPNTFTPNGDGINDNWEISVNDDVVAIRELNIFDRWGNLIHHLTGKEVWDGMELWDGHFGNKPMDAGVFAYQLVYELQGGKILFKTGDVTLLR